MHSLDNCVFLLYDRNELIGLCGVYVDDFLIAGRDNDPRWQDAKGNLSTCTHGAHGKRESFIFAEFDTVNSRTSQSQWIKKSIPCH